MDSFAASSSERRISLRTELAGTVLPVDIGDSFGLLYDLSPNGIGVHSVRPLVAGTGMRIAFAPVELSTPISAFCEVAWTDDANRAGFRFISFDEAEQHKAYLRWVQTIQRDAAHGVRGETRVLSSDLELPRREFPAERLPEVKRLREEVGDSLEKIVSKTASITLAQGAVVALLGAEGFTCRASFGMAPEIGAKVDSGAGLSGECIRSGRVVRCDDTQRDPRVNAAAAQELGVRSVVVAPVVADGKTVGIIEVLSKWPNTFFDRHVRLVEETAEIVAEFYVGGVRSVAATAVAAAGAGSSSAGTVMEIGRPDVAHVRPSVATGSSVQKERQRAPGTNIRGAMFAMSLLAASSLFVGWRYAHLTAPLPLPKIDHPVSRVSTSTSIPHVSLRSSTSGVESSQRTHSVGKPAVEKSVVSKSTSHESKGAQYIADDSIVLVPSNRQGSTGVSLADERAPLATPGSVPPVEMNVAFASGDAKVRTVSKGVTGGQLLSKVTPEYPAAARAAHISGIVHLSATVGEDGSVSGVEVIDGPKLLRDSAVSAVKHWRYQPFTLNGSVVATNIVIAVSFKDNPK